MNRKVLVFPGGMPRSLDFSQQCEREGKRVVGSSSIVDDPFKSRYPEWVFLPYVVDPTFAAALRLVLSEKNIGGIYTPNPVVWAYLKELLAASDLGVELLNESPISAELLPYREARVFAQALLARPASFDTEQEAKPHLAVREIASLFRHAQTIPGMCDHEKIRALCEVSRYSPPGDIVEIGSWWGKSAFVLLQLARSHGIGNVLCVDPWSDGHLAQGEQIVDLVSARCSADEAFDVYRLNLLPYAGGNLNYLRMPSVAGAKHYQDARSVETPDFGRVVYTGRIAILHIDGNHSYESAKADVDAWAGLVTDGGWIIIDDYVWPFGDGPRRVGDEFLALCADDIFVSFVRGSALFIQLLVRTH